MKLNIALLLTVLMPLSVTAQPQWQRDTTPAKPPPLELFPSTMLPNLPTTEALSKGDFEYEISHRFIPAITSGYDKVWGIEGPVNMRMAVGYGMTDQTTATLGFSTLLNNLELQLKQKLFEIRSTSAPSVVSVRGGLSWNTEIPNNINRGVGNADNFQYYLQGIFNTMLFDKRLGVGLVPSYLYNSSIFTPSRESTFALGTYGQVFINRTWSLWAEYTPTISGYQGPILLGDTGKYHDSMALGFDLDTGGHSFFIFLSNNARLNTAQYLVGADTKPNSKDFRLGFGITRRL